jgi:hypothetical protein
MLLLPLGAFMASSRANFTCLLLPLLLLELDATDWGSGRGMKWLRDACCQQACNVVLQSKAGLAICKPQEGHIISLRTSSRAAFIYMYMERGEGVKGKFLVGRDLEDPEGEWRYNSTLSLTSWVGGQRHALAALSPGKRRVH